MLDSSPRLTHRVKVVELDPEVLTERRLRKRNPGRRTGTQCVYVGMTGLPVADRFESYRRGHKRSRYMRQYGRRLRPELFEFLNPMPYKAAQQMEVDLAEEVLAHFVGLQGAEVRVTIEIEAEVPGGVPESVVRTVTENGRTLKFSSQGFEID